jgi:hypothetical protein
MGIDMGRLDQQKIPNPATCVPGMTLSRVCTRTRYSPPFLLHGPRINLEGNQRFTTLLLTHKWIDSIPVPFVKFYNQASKGRCTLGRDPKVRGSYYCY